MSKRIEFTQPEIIALLELYLDIEVSDDSHCFTPTNERIYDKLLAKVSPKTQKKYRPYWRKNYEPLDENISMADFAEKLKERFGDMTLAEILQEMKVRKRRQIIGDCADHPDPLGCVMRRLKKLEGQQ